MLCLMLDMSDFPAIFATNDRWLTTKLYDNERVVLWMTSLVFRSKTKEVSRNADLTFEKISPDGVHHMSVVLVHKAAFFFLSGCLKSEKAQDCNCPVPL